MIRLRRRGERRSPGQSLAEFTLAIPVFLLIVVGIAEGGFYVVATTIVSSATHEGARLGVLASTSSLSTVRNRVIEASSPVVTVPSGNVTLALTAGGSTTDPCNNSCYTGRKTGDRLKVKTSYTHSPLLSYVFPGLTFPASAEAELLVEGDGS